MNQLTFTLGDFLVLIILAAVLFIYRQLDKNNRSLERVKRYADQAQGQLQEIVDAKARDLKDLGIEIDVHQQALKSVLHHVHESTQSLEQKADEIDGLSQKILDYERIITELVEKTKVAQENLQRVKDESRFVDGVGKRIKEAAESLGKIEKSIPAMTSEFARVNSDQNREHGELLTRGFQESIERKTLELDEQLAVIRQELGNQRVNLGDQIAKFQIESEEIQSNFAEKIQAAAVDGRDLKAEILSSLTNRFSEEVSVLERQMRDSVSALMEEQLGSEDQLKEWKQSYTQRLGSAEEELEARIRDQEEKIRRKIEDVLTAQEELAQAQETGFREIESKMESQNESFQGLLYDTEQQLRQDLEQVREKGNALADTALRKMDQDVEAKTESIRAQIHESLEDLTHRTEATHSTIDRNFGSLQEHLDSYVRESKIVIESLDSRMEDLTQRLEKDKIYHENQIHDFVQSSKERIAEQEETLADQLTSLTNQLSEVRQEAESTVHGFQSELMTQVQNARNLLDQRIGELRDEHDARLEDSSRGVHDKVDSILADARERIQEIRTALEQENLDLRRLFESFQGDNRQEAKNLHLQFLKELEEFRVAEVVTANQSQDSFRALIEELSQKVQTDLGDAGAELARLRDLQKEMGAKNQDLRGEFLTKSEELHTFILSQYTEIQTRLLGKGDQVEQAVIKELELKLREYEEAFGYRIHSLEQVSLDASNLDHELRKLLDRTRNRLEEDLKSQADGIRTERHNDLLKAREEMGQLVEEMGTLEKSLQDLKERAYQTTSDKLKNFEEDFFQDLRIRSEKMDNDFEEWKLRVSDQLDALMKFSNDKTDELQKSFLEKLHTDVGQLQSEAAEHLTKLQEFVKAHEKTTQDRLSTQQSLLLQHEQRTKDEILVLHEKTMETLQGRLGLLEDQQVEKIRSLKGSMENLVMKVEKDVSEKTEDIQGSLTNLGSDLVLWQTKYLNQLRAAEQDIEGEIAKEARKNLEHLQTLETNLREKAQVLQESIEEEMDGIRSLVRDSEIKVQESYQNLVSLSDSALTEFLSSKKRASVELEEDIRDFKNLSAKVREEFEGTQKRLMEGLVSRTDHLDQTLQEIDKRQKLFLGQTKLFERADSLKDLLTQDIGVLTQEISRLSEEKKQFSDIATLVNRLKTLADDANNKLERVFAEKKRIEVMDTQISNLLGQSDQVNQKLLQIQEQQDEVIEIQKSLRELEVLEKGVAHKFERLEKKSGILDTTIEGVDKNFQQLSDLENRFMAIYTDIETTIPDRIDHIDGQISQISLKKKEADLAMKNLSTLDSLSSDLEKRLEDISKAREWLARTETRFEEVTRKASEQVQILSTLVKEEGKEAGTADSIPGSAKDLVIRLAHQGWKIEEIARTTKLSRGEIELILEMTQK
ncbi:MAG: hypothetical protein GW949_06720 [Spirochaetales bacterium]|nr:hypothetical protein [Spirochaetales bacterium]